MQSIAHRIRSHPWTSQLLSQSKWREAQTKLLFQCQVAKELTNIIIREQQFTLPNQQLWQAAKQETLTLIPSDGIMNGLERLGSITWGQMAIHGQQALQLASLYYLGKLTSQFIHLFL